MANNRRRLEGRVVSDKMDKTVTVAIENRKMHRVYKKVVSTTKKVLAHDETNEVPVGAVVRIVESRPLSKNKRWVVEAVLDTPEDVERRKLEARHAAQEAAAQVAEAAAVVEEVVEAEVEEVVEEVEDDATPESGDEEAE